MILFPFAVAMLLVFGMELTWPVRYRGKGFK